MAALLGKPGRWWAALLGAMLVAATLAFAGTALAHPKADSLLEQRAGREQPVEALLDDGFSALIRCREDCLLSGRIAIRTAARRWRVVGRFESLQLAGGDWQELIVPLSERGRALVRRSRKAVALRARNRAISLESATYGDTDSVQKLRR